MVPSQRGRTFSQQRNNYQRDVPPTTSLTIIPSLAAYCVGLSRSSLKCQSLLLITYHRAAAASTDAGQGPKLLQNVVVVDFTVVDVAVVGG